MKRDEFLKLYPLPQDREDMNVYLKDSLTEYVYVGAIPNNLIKLNRISLINMPADYSMRLVDMWEYATRSQFEETLKNREKIIEEAIKKSQIAQHIVDKISYEADVMCIPNFVRIDGAEEIYDYKIFVRFFFPVEVMLLEWKGNYSRKLFIFVNDGVFIAKYPPYNLKSVSPLGFTGIQAYEQAIVVSQ
ncbi:hypothetical protein [Anaerocellum danielii]|uniref:Uncharacterized protein n=1 Tax=Anaerocellum danielii TaxID=1387557 RepID=A0ABZ0TY46_9FIRM|nr:hypothetical protein [Caldicellulosiruptor danielii]WPX08137.1 hypothetical protein SOJ16_002001 [Caldicellulosiruptor danielii]